MRSQDYVAWSEHRAGIPPHPVLRPGDDVVVERRWPDHSFACDPARCAKICCTGWKSGRGIRLTVADLLRLKDAGHLDSVEGVFREDPRDHPRLRSVDGRCVHYDVETRRCTIWDHRPLICQTFPFAIASVAPSGRVEFTFASGCSLTPERLEPPPPGAWERSDRHLTVRSTRLGHPAVELPAYERAHLDAAIEAVNEHERTRHLVSERPDLLEQLGLDAFTANEADRPG